MQGSFKNNKHTEEDKAEEISPLVDGQSYYSAEKDQCVKDDYIREQEIMRN